MSDLKSRALELRGRIAWADSSSPGQIWQALDALAAIVVDLAGELEQVNRERSTKAVERRAPSKAVGVPAARELLSPSFARAWEAWPKKTEKKKSAEQYAKAVRKLGEQQAEAAVVAFGQAYAATTDKQFVPALCVWLRGERWTDELPTAQAPQSRVRQGLSLADELRQMEVGHAGE